jgi:hypothetical protein
MGRVKTFTAGGSLLPGDLNNMEDDYEFAFSTYRTLARGWCATLAGSAGINTYLVPLAGGTPTVAPQNYAGFGFYFDPADWTANTRVNKLRLRAQLLTNTVAPATNVTVGLYPIATYGGTSGNQPTIASLGAVVASSTVTFATPGASSQNQGNSGDFTAPTAGFYVLAFATNNVSAVNSVYSVTVELQRRQA